MQSFNKSKPAVWKSLDAQNACSIWGLIGVFFLLCGLAIFSNSSIYHKLFYLFFIPPAIFFVFKEKIKIFRNPIVFTYIALSAVIILSTYLNNPEDLSNSIKRSVYLLALLITSCLITSHRKWLKIIAIIAATITLGINFYFFIPFLKEIIISNSANLRFIGGNGLENPLLSSHVFGFFTVLTTILSIKSHNKKQTLWLSVLAISFFVLTLSTGSRTPILALACTVIWLIFISKNKSLIAVSIGFALCIVTMGLIYPEAILSRGLSYRPELWSLTIKEIIKSPILGYGFDAHPSLFIESLNTAFREAHNIHLSVAYYSGIAGFMLWITIHIIALAYCIKNKHENYFLVASCLIIYGVCAGMTEGGSIFPRPKEQWFITWIPLALAAGLIYQKVNEKSPDK